MTCVPFVFRALVRPAPVPSTPSLLEVQVSLADRFPSSRSVAEATNEIGVPALTVRLFGGEAIVTIGRASTVTVTVASPARPPESVTEAVTRRVPAGRLVSVRLVPLPRGPTP